MILTKSMSDFENFINIANSANTTYKILCSKSQKTGTTIGESPVKIYEYRFVLCCSLFQVAFCEKNNTLEKEIAERIVSNQNCESCKLIKIDNGNFIVSF